MNIITRLGREYHFEFCREKVKAHLRMMLPSEWGTPRTEASPSHRGREGRGDASLSAYYVVSANSPLKKPEARCSGGL